MTTPFIITGVPTTPGSNGSVPLRHEIRDLQQNYPQQWDLFCLGLLALQSVDENDQLSYYQLAGIHGLPYKAWNGVTGIDGAQSGYCTHSSILFLPWHRPYLCLFEQILSNKIQAIAQTYNENLRAQYVSAAQEFRLPYWDWGLLPQSGQSAFPSSIAEANIQITGLSGEKETVANPLLQYNFNVNNLSSGDFPDAPYNTWANTYRYPQDSSRNTVSQEALVNSAITSQTQAIRSQIRYIFGSISDFGPFSNDIWIPSNPGTYPSLEDIHDNIHVLVGGPSPSDQSAPAGNMSIIPYAAFDPVFWLHHCNVDRMFAIFQALHPNSYVEDEPTSDGTFTEPPGHTETVTSDLTPFWKDSSTFHTSETAEATISLGYAYPETQSWNYETSNLYQKSVQAAVKKLYATTISSSGAIIPPAPGSLSAAAGFKQGNGTTNGKAVLPQDLTPKINSSKNPGFLDSATNVGPIADRSQKPTNNVLISKIGDNIKNTAGKVNFLSADKAAASISTSNDGTDDTPAPLKYMEWITNIRVQKHCLNGAFQVHIFLGDVPADANSWLVHANNVGTCSILGSNQMTTNCEKCKKDASTGLIVTGIIPLTEAIHDAVLNGHLRSTDIEDVELYLAKMLSWRVTQPDGKIKHPTEVDDLLISVVTTEFSTPNEADELPVGSGIYSLHPACTEGKPGGYSHGDQY